MSQLADRECVPCQGGVPPLAGEELQTLARELDAGWRVVEDHHLAKRFEFPDFASALAFVNRVGELAEEVGHHPEIRFSWGWVEIEIYTHKIDGLNQADFVWAARAEGLADA